MAFIISTYGTYQLIFLIILFTLSGANVYLYIYAR